MELPGNDTSNYKIPDTMIPQFSFQIQNVFSSSQYPLVISLCEEYCLVCYRHNPK